MYILQDFNYPLLDTVQSPNIGNLPEMERKSLKLIRTTFEDNIAAPLGVGFDLERGNGGPIEVSNTLPFKKPSPSGGAIFSLTYEVDADSCLFKGNRASTGGAMYLKDNGKISVSNCKFIDNHLKALVKDIEQGGAIYIFSIKTSFQVLIVNIEVYRPFHSCSITTNHILSQNCGNTNNYYIMSVHFFA